MCKLAAVFTLCVATSARAQVLACGPSDVVPWWPRVVANAGGNTLSAADRATVEARLGAIEAPNARQEDRSQQAELYRQLDWAAIKKMVN